MADGMLDPRSIQAITREVKRMILAILAAALVGAFGLLGLLWASSPGTPRPILGSDGQPVPGSLSEKVFVEVNGVRQGMIIKSRDPSNPVLLYLHGGMPETFLAPRYPTGLEDVFTVVWWEQRGAGLSYRDDVPQETFTVEQLIADTLSVTDYLRSRFGQDKVYLMAHSGGTFIGIQAAARAPEKYLAYIGMAQMSNQLESEVLAYDFMLASFRDDGNSAMVRKLEAAPVTITGGVPADYLAVRDAAMHSLGVGTTHAMHSVITGILLPSLAFPEYTMAEKLNLWRGKAKSGVSVVWETSLATDLSQTLTELALPVYIFGGIYDYTCSTELAREYFEKLRAPAKGFYTFERSAHSPLFEEPDLALKILREDVLAESTRLADAE